MQGSRSAECSVRGQCQFLRVLAAAAGAGGRAGKRHAALLGFAGRCCARLRRRSASRAARTALAASAALAARAAPGRKRAANRSHATARLHQSIFVSDRRVNEYRELKHELSRHRERGPQCHEFKHELNRRREGEGGPEYDERRQCDAGRDTQSEKPQRNSADDRRGLERKRRCRCRPRYDGRGERNRDDKRDRCRDQEHGRPGFLGCGRRQHHRRGGGSCFGKWPSSRAGRPDEKNCGRSPRRLAQ